MTINNSNILKTTKRDKTMKLSSHDNQQYQHSQKQQKETKKDSRQQHKYKYK